jgi:hypothetical protein
MQRRVIPENITQLYVTSLFYAQRTAITSEGKLPC